MANLDKYKKSKDGEKKGQVSVSAKEIEAKREDEQGNFAYILDLLSRPSRAVAGAASAPGNPTEGLSRAYKNLTGERQDQWSKNIADMTGVKEDSWTARLGGFAGDAVLDPLNLVGPAGKIPMIAKGLNTVRKGAHGIQTASKAGKYGKLPQAISNTAKELRGIGSNYAGLSREEQALVQLFDAKKHSLDDLAKAEALKVLESVKPQLAQLNPMSSAYSGLQATAAQNAIDAGKSKFEQMMKAAQAELGAKAGANMTPDMTEHVGKRLQMGNKVPKGQNRFEADMSPTMAKYLNWASNGFGAKWNEKPIRWGLDRITGADRTFKKMATRYNLPFYENNAMGNIQQTAQEASNHATGKFGKDVLDSFTGKPYRDTAEMYLREYANKIPGVKLGSGIKGYTPDQLKELGKTRGVMTNVSSIYKGKEATGSLEETLGELAKVYLDMHGAAKTGTAAKVLKPLETAKHAGTRFLDSAQSGVEGGSRQAAFATYFKQALQKGLPEAEAADEAALRVTQSLFDYEDVTPIVRAIRSTPIIGQPFVTWPVKNVPRQAANAVKNPQYMSKLDAMSRITKDDTDKNTHVPGYMRERGSIPISRNAEKKETTFFNPALAASDVNQIPMNLKTGELKPETLVKGMAPTGKALTALWRNKDSFTGNPLSREDRGMFDLMDEPQTVQPDMRWIMEKAPQLFDALGASRAKTTGNPQAPFWLKTATDMAVAPRNILRGVHSAVDPKTATDKTPFGLGSLLPIDVKSDKQLKVSKQLEDKELAKKVKQEKMDKLPKRRLTKLAKR